MVVQVIGFSWQDTHLPAGFPYYGFDVAWVCISISLGVCGMDLLIQLSVVVAEVCSRDRGSDSSFVRAMCTSRDRLFSDLVFFSSLASFLPPSNTLRAYQRRMMSTTVAEMGAVYCSVVSFANTQHSYELDRGTIIQSLIAIRLKLKRSLVLRTNIVYEVSPYCIPPAEAAY